MNGNGKDLVSHGAFYGLLTALIGVVAQLAHKHTDVTAVGSAIITTIGFIHTIVAVIKTDTPITSIFGFIKLKQPTQEPQK